MSSKQTFYFDCLQKLQWSDCLNNNSPFCHHQRSKKTAMLSISGTQVIFCNYGTFSLFTLDIIIQTFNHLISILECQLLSCKLDMNFHQFHSLASNKCLSTLFSQYRNPDFWSFSIITALLVANATKNLRAKIGLSVTFLEPQAILCLSFATSSESVQECGRPVEQYL